MGKVFGSKADQGEFALVIPGTCERGLMRVEVASLQAEMAGLRAMESQVARSLSAMKIKKVCRIGTTCSRVMLTR